MDESINRGSIAIHKARHLREVDTAETILDQTSTPAEITVPTTASWSEAISSIKERFWGGY